MLTVKMTLQNSPLKGVVTTVKFTCVTDFYIENNCLHAFFDDGSKEVENIKNLIRMEVY